MPNLLLEIGCEEIPARFMPDLLADFKDKAEEVFKEEKLSFTNIQTLGTAQRIILFVEDLAKQQDDQFLEQKGPPCDIVFDKGNNLTPAGQGFLKKYQVTISETFKKSDGKKEYLYARVEKKGQKTTAILSNLINRIITSLYLPIEMRWGQGETKFIRPIHWVLGLYGKETIKGDVFGIKISNATYGHRLLTNSRKAVILEANLPAYIARMKKLKVMIDPKERIEIITSQILFCAKMQHLEAQIDADLISEVNFLVEFPIAYMGKFDPKFLALPKEVLITSMKKNQKYFPLYDRLKHLQPFFILVSNGTLQKDSSSVIAGNARVLAARLSDAVFFYQEDLKTKLADRTFSLKNVSYIEKIGTLWDKAERLKKLSVWLAKELKNKPVIPFVERAAYLCKADLVTQMVFEFPILQGIMGKVYALNSGEEQAVAEAIFEHYLPRFSGDILPQSDPGVILALADKIDLLAGCFAIGLIPSGSQDPFALRRAALGIIAIVLKYKLSLSLQDVFSEAYKLFQEQFPGVVNPDFVGLEKAWFDFIEQRFKGVLQEAKIRHDIADAVLYDFNDIWDVFQRGKELNALIKESFVQGVAATGDRIARLASKSTREKIEEKDLVEETEKKVYSLYMQVNWEVGEALKAADTKKALQALARLTQPIEELFNKVMIMVEDPQLKENRLALLSNLDRMYKEVADFGKISI